ncbi:MAG: SPOR domain-containing protein [Saprospiraceae bacterium]|nr:MAG: sporulation domain-containing protein [Bacteroidetes bacterium OLB9]MCO6463203.1 SPOR domain-containing protein [Saprospiraceae bacterium]MCZ2338987.1 SPOR domain-containing protein [Chitinophagales bacterium]
MGRIIRIVLYAVVILILYFWATSILNSYLPKPTMEPSTSVVSEGINDHSVVSPEANADSMDIDQNVISNEEIVGQEFDYEHLDEKVQKLEDKQKSLQQNTNVAKGKLSEQPKNTNTFTHDENGQYMVMAGSFLLEDNAKDMVKKLHGIGFKDAKVVVFNASEYHSVIALRSSSSNAAQAAVRELKSKGIDSFVKTK